MSLTISVSIQSQGGVVSIEHTHAPVTTSYEWICFIIDISLYIIDAKRIDPSLGSVW